MKIILILIILSIETVVECNVSNKGMRHIGKQTSNAEQVPPCKCGQNVQIPPKQPEQGCGCQEKPPKPCGCGQDCKCKPCLEPCKCKST